MNRMILVTGGAGFIGSNFLHYCASHRADPTVVVDKLTYAGNISNLNSLPEQYRSTFVHADIKDPVAMRSVFIRFAPSAVVHFAAESHVDRSILAPDEFIQTNINGTFNLLQMATEYWRNLGPNRKDRFRFLHVSTDEVYGSLGECDPAFTEQTPYAPNSPYSASKAASDHLVRAFHHTYGLPTLTTNCSNNYGPFQFPEKLIPLMILNATREEALPIYGDGRNVRDWLYVGDHCEAIMTVLHLGTPGETYNIGGRAEMSNLEVVMKVCSILDELRPRSGGASYASLIKFVKDRPGHDRRYAMDISRIKSYLGWEPKENFESGIRKTIEWYLQHPEWIESISNGSYREWVKTQYAGK